MRETLNIHAGLAVIRYVALADGPPNAVISLSVVQDGNSNAEIIYDPSIQDEALSIPGQIAIIKAHSDARVVVDINSTDRSQTPRGSLKVEYLMKYRVGGNDRGTSQAPGRSFARGKDGASSGSLNLRITGHVAYRGDVVVGNGEWICGPDNPNRIEGIRIDWNDAPAGVELRYRAPGSVVPSSTGDYAGTKGRSKPLEGLELWLEGPQASNYTIDAIGLFPGNYKNEQSGQNINLLGPEGRSALIGLRVGVRPVGGAASDKSQDGVMDFGRVRLYRPTKY